MTIRCFFLPRYLAISLITAGLILCHFAGENVAQCQAVETLDLGPQELAHEKVFSNQQKEKILRGQQYAVQMGGRDYGELYDVLSEKKGDLEGIKRLCRYFNALVCLRQASHDNPELRKEICEQLRQVLRQKAGKKVDVEQHHRECLLGLRQPVM